MTSGAEFFDISPDEILSRDIDDMILNKYRNTPRNLQTELGPSEIGHPCPRNLAYKLMQEPECNTSQDPLPSIVGTAAHSWMDDAAKQMNEALGRTKWLGEQRVSMRDSGFPSGSCDLVDLDSFTIVDHKFLGPSQIEKYKAPGATMPTIYRVQLHSYGLGASRMGLPIKRVCLNILPRGGQLKNKIMFTEDFDPQIALDALERLDNISMLLDVYDVENHPENYRLFPAVAGDCFFCPFWRPKAPEGPYECNGKVIGLDYDPTES